MICQLARSSQLCIRHPDLYPRSSTPIPSLLHGPRLSRTPPLPSSRRAERTKWFSLPSSARLFSHFTTLDPHRYALLPPPSASRAATTRIAVSYAANVMADAGALFTSPGANPL